MQADVVQLEVADQQAEQEAPPALPAEQSEPTGRAPRPRKLKARKLRAVRPPRDPARQALEADAEAVRRVLRDALDAKDANRLRDLRAQVVEGKTAATESTTNVTTEAATGAATVSTTPHTAAGADPRGPAWPPPAKVAQIRPLLGQLMLGAQLALRQTRFNIEGTTAHPLTGEPVSKAEYLADSLAPLAAKYLPDDLNTPESQAAAALFVVFGAPLLATAMDRMTAAIERQQTPAQATQH